MVGGIGDDGVGDDDGFGGDSCGSDASTEVIFLFWLPTPTEQHPPLYPIFVYCFRINVNDFSSVLLYTYSYIWASQYDITIHFSFFPNLKFIVCVCRRNIYLEVILFILMLASGDDDVGGAGEDVEVGCGKLGARTVVA